MSKSLFDLDPNEPQVMAVLNVTPDSFSDGGDCFESGQFSKGRCRQKIESLLEQGASIIDVGGESTRPGAEEVSIQQELDRVMPALEILQDYDAVVSLDSSTPDVFIQALNCGLGLINDVRALSRDGAMQVAANSGLPVCLMHMQGQPDNMQDSPSYQSVIEEIKDYLVERVKQCEAAGIARSRLLVDPGFGFGKTLQHNLAILRELESFKSLQLPILVGMSRKSMIEHALGARTIPQRLPGSLALAALAVERGAWIVRAHDVRETVDVVRLTSAVMRENNG